MRTALSTLRSAPTPPSTIATARTLPAAVAPAPVMAPGMAPAAMRPRVRAWRPRCRRRATAPSRSSRRTTFAPLCVGASRPRTACGSWQSHCRLWAT
eukprot:565741-Prymnesium_polylepis.1